MIETQKADKIVTVGQLTASIKAILEGGIGSVTVRGEISNWRPATSGHIYFSLKDSEAMISAAFFRGLDPETCGRDETARVRARPRRTGDGAPGDRPPKCDQRRKRVQEAALAAARAASKLGKSVISGTYST